jgi:heptosyltransferase-1
MPSRILMVRLGAMGDVIHVLPAAATLKQSFPSAHLTWAIHPKWVPLLENNPYVDDLLPFDRRSWASIRAAHTRLRNGGFNVAIDFQGLVKSGLVVRASRASKRIGFHRKQAREPLAARFYTHQVETNAAHFVEQCLELAGAAGAGRISREFPVPAGNPEGELPADRYVIACPLAGWKSKQWPPEYYGEVARALRIDGLALVVNGPPKAAAELARIPGAHLHVSGIEGLIDATRGAAGVIGLDSGPLHLAAALGKPGVAIFGPTNPLRNGPYGGTIAVLRAPGAPITYQRGNEISPSMRAVRPEEVINTLRIALEMRSTGLTA